MKIGDEVYVHGYIDEIRYDDTKRVSTIIIRNDGGYFGTVPSEITADHKTENSSEKPNNCGARMKGADDESVE